MTETTAYACKARTREQADRHIRELLGDLRLILDVHVTKAGFWQRGWWLVTVTHSPLPRV